MYGTQTHLSSMWRTVHYWRCHSSPRIPHIACNWSWFFQSDCWYCCKIIIGKRRYGQIVTGSRSMSKKLRCFFEERWKLTVHLCGMNQRSYFRDLSREILNFPGVPRLESSAQWSQIGRNDHLRNVSFYLPSIKYSPTWVLHILEPTLLLPELEDYLSCGCLFGNLLVWSGSN